jgi:hypothetical protein
MTTKAQKRVLTWGLLLLAPALAVPVAYLAGRARAAGIPATQTLTYSGLLTDAAGTPLTGSMPIQLGVFDAATAGNLLCVTPSGPQTLSGGSFQVTLPDTCTAAVRGSADLWVEVTVGGVPIGRTKLGAVPYAVVAAETSCGSTSGATMIDTGAGFCIDTADRPVETVYGSAISSCAAEGKMVCSFVQLCTAKLRNVGAIGTGNYRVSDLMFFTGDNTHYFGAGSGSNALTRPAACATIAAPGPHGGAGIPFRCCRGKG